MVRLKLEKRDDGYRPPRGWRRHVWADCMFLGLIALAAGLLLYFLISRVISLFR